MEAGTLLCRHRPMKFAWFRVGFFPLVQACFVTRRHKSEDIAPPMAWRRKAWKEEALDDLERGRAMVNQTNYKCFKGITGETPKRRSGAHMGLSLICHRDCFVVLQSVQDRIYAFQSVSQLFVTRCLQGRPSSASSYSSLTALDGAMSLSLCPLLLSQAPQTFNYTIQLYCQVSVQLH